MSALPPKADMCGATRDVRFVPIADIAVKKKDRLAAASLLCRLSISRQADCFCRLRYAISPSAPRPVAKSGRAAGMGVSAGAAETENWPSPTSSDTTGPGVITRSKLKPTGAPNRL